jgi:hypothetical protein
MSVAPLILDERDSVSFTHVLLHALEDCAGQRFSREHPLVMWLGAFVTDNASDERLKGEVILESGISIGRHRHCHSGGRRRAGGQDGRRVRLLPPFAWDYLRLSGPIGALLLATINTGIDSACKGSPVRALDSPVLSAKSCSV